MVIALGFASFSFINVYTVEKAGMNFKEKSYGRDR